MDNLFEDFQNELEQEQEHIQDLGPKVATLVKVLAHNVAPTDTETLVCIYLEQGRVEDMEELRQFMIDIMMNEYTAPDVIGAYTESIIADKKEAIENSFKLVYDKLPTEEEKASTRKFNEEFKRYIE